ncbi:predicted protein [Postia placenta Mad-698-R]|uniref:AAA+ ATPase domain-containing protein n=1 Tax=Postia placenta MAD-698-R-SB12 TaxID=670580 RepID=A0A1X6MRA6_9APHY|nr:hypothetical protein POSPLADRAFT_1049093 [Postia placenta MAD-698-R-SB12]EED82184.1 predicted protein [Postia placenta Mad-698-R]OSX58924.1 hypothetical protein POSPLADRAFT_1049093 [Postia placenta MAD-698-R-SB12]
MSTTTNRDDQQSIHNSTRTLRSSQTSIAETPEDRLSFNDELDELWTRCRSLVDSLHLRFIHPTHVALCLLYDGLQSVYDPRFYDISTPQTWALERPLFWIAISKVYASELSDSLDDHIQKATFPDEPASTPIQKKIADDLWARTKTLNDDRTQPTEDRDSERATGFQQSTEEGGIRGLLESSKFGISADAVIEITRRLRQKKVEEQMSKPKFVMLSQFAVEDTRLIKEKLDRGELIDPIVGRNREIRRLISILSRKSKNNAVLLGDSGVGKSAIAEGLALRIVSGNVPESVRARVFSLNLGALLASTACKSAYEQILQLILDEIAEHESMGISAILFIDELSQITIGGYRGDGSGMYTSVSQLFPRLPDSAIELLDEACTNVKISKDANWEQLGKWRRRKVAIEMDIESLEREFDGTGDTELQRMQEELKNLEIQIESCISSARSSRPLEKELAEIEQSIRIQEKSILTRGQAGQYKEKKEDVQQLMRLKEKKIIAQQKLDQSRMEMEAHNMLTPSEPPPVSSSPEELPVVTKLHVVAQPEAVESISSAVRCLLSGLTDPSRPVASFVLGGPSGSGQVLLAKELARSLLGSAEKLICIHGVDYADAHAISRLVGTPACTGFDHGGQLTECVKRKPFSVILIQDIEKASQEFRLHIQRILDEGTLRDGAGKVIDFTNCIVIMTTSVGQEGALEIQTEEEERKHFVKEVQDWFPVEFFARIDELVIFRRVTADMMSAIVDSRIRDLEVHLSHIKLFLEVDPQAKLYLEISGLSPNTGAQSLERIIRSQVLRPLSLLFLNDEVKENWTIRLRYDELQDGIIIEPVEPEPNPQFTSDQTIPTATSPSSSPSSSTSTLDDSDNGEQVGQGASVLSDRDVLLASERGGHHRVVVSLLEAPTMQLQPQRVLWS